MDYTVKTRQEIAELYGISRKTFYNWLKREDICLENRLVSPKEQKIIYEKLGNPIKQPHRFAMR